MVALSHNNFLTELTRLFEATQTAGSLSLTHKRITDNDTPSCLIRARTEKKKISTIVHSKDLLRFQASLGTILRVHMTSLKRKDRSKKS